MPAYAIQDTIQERQDIDDAAALSRDEWIDKRAKEIEIEYPEEPVYFASSHLSQVIRLGLHSPPVIEAYNEFKTIAAYDRAEREWDNRFSWLLSDETFED